MVPPRHGTVVLDVDESVAFVVEGVVARGHFAEGVAEDFGEGFDYAHEDVLAGDGGHGLVFVEVDGDGCVGDVVAEWGGEIGCSGGDGVSGW